MERRDEGVRADLGRAITGSPPPARALIQTSKRPDVGTCRGQRHCPLVPFFPPHSKHYWSLTTDLDFIGTFFRATCFAHGLKEEDPMWIAIFASTLSLALCFCVAATLMQPKTDQSQVLGR